MDTPVYVVRPFLPDLDQLMPLLEGVWSRRTVTNFGPLEQELSAKLNAVFASREVLLFSNGHLAIEGMLNLLEPRGEIITTPFTFASTIHAIINTGHQPVLVDVEAGGLGPDPEQVEAAVTPRTRAILGVHVYGVPCDTDALDAIAQRHGLAVLYDAAHAFGVQHNGRSLIGYGDASAVSFHATKVFNTIEGGCIAVNSAQIDIDACRRYRNFGLVGTDVQGQASNAKMSEMHAAVGLLNLDGIDAAIERRRSLAARYNEAFKGVNRFAPLEPRSPNASYYPLQMSGPRDKTDASRAELIAHLNDRGIFPRPYFSPALHQTTRFAPLAAGKSYPRSEQLADSVLCLPIYDSMTEAEQTRVIEAAVGWASE